MICCYEICRSLYLQLTKAKPNQADWPWYARIGSNQEFQMISYEFHMIWYNNRWKSILVSSGRHFSNFIYYFPIQLRKTWDNIGNTFHSPNFNCLFNTKQIKTVFSDKILHRKKPLWTVYKNLCFHFQNQHNDLLNRLRLRWNFTKAY